MLIGGSVVSQYLKTKSVKLNNNGLTILDHAHGGRDVQIWNDN